MEELSTKSSGELQPAIEKLELILDKERMARLGYIHVRVISRIDLERVIPEVLAFKLVTTGNQIAPDLHIKTSIDCVNASVKVRSRRPPERLKVDTQWTIAPATVCYQSLVADRIAKRFRWTLRENERPVKEVCLPPVVGIIGRRYERGGSFVQLRYGHSSFITMQFR